MINHTEEADFVLVVCTEKYEKRFKGKDEAGKGLGVKWEGAIITQELYYSEANNKCIPIVFSPEDSKHIPAAFKSATYYNLNTEVNCEEAYEELYARLTNQILVVKPSIGELRVLKPKHLSNLVSGRDKENKLAENKPKPVIGELITIPTGEEGGSIGNTITSPSTGMEFVLISAGKFIMGSPSDEQGRWEGEGPVHEVIIKNSFYMGKFPVTQKQWEKVMGNNPSKFRGEDLPVESVSWNDVQEFIKKLNEKESTVKYRLPSESEWEYACRAGTTTRYSFGDDESKLGDYAWYSKNSGSKTHPVCQKNPNHWGLYDMHGNVWEWCQDTWHDNYNGAPSDDSAWEDESGSSRVIRGGSWNYDAGRCRSASRSWNDPVYRFDFLGFRLLRKL